MFKNKLKNIKAPLKYRIGSYVLDVNCLSKLYGVCMVFNN